jgi:hypothetical protein
MRVMTTMITKDICWTVGNSYWSKEEMEWKKRSKENDRDARASSPMGGARSPFKKARQVLLPRQRQVVQRGEREAQL